MKYSVKMLIAGINFIFAMPKPGFSFILLQDVLILSRMTYLSLSGLARDCCSFILINLKVDSRDILCCKGHASCINLIVAFCLLSSMFRFYLKSMSHEP